MFSRILHNRFFITYRFFVILIFQLFIVGVSYFLSFAIRFEFNIPKQYLQIFFMTLPSLLICRMVANYFFKIHLGSWKFVSMQDLTDTVKATATGSILFLVTMVFVLGLMEYPRTVFILEMMLTLLLIGGSRFSIRYLSEIKEGRKLKISKNVLIAGAGKAGILLVKEAAGNPELGIRVSGFIDDDGYKLGMYVHGIPILGHTKDIPHLVKKFEIDEVIIAMPSAKYKDIARIKEVARTSDVEVKVLPEVGRVIQDDYFNGPLKDVAFNELLGRRVVRFSRESDSKLMRGEINDKAVLVTGAGGSIGSELCRQVVQLSPRLLLLYDRYENSLYDLEIELKKSFPHVKFVPIIGDILDGDKVEKVLKTYKVSLVYHAAAYKHVPMMEREPVEAIRNNIFGTLNVAKLAVANNVDKFVLISTDKAVNPANVMGTTKRICELIIQGLSRFDTKFIAVRFGNVIGSNGSVIPLFKKQINEGGPVTVTHPDITRYFMSIPEAVQLVMTAGAMGKGGEIFLLDMGRPIKIAELAKDLIKRSGLEPGSDIDIVFTGLRPGEKLYEELYWKGEGIVPTDNKKITMLKTGREDYARVFDTCKKMEEYTLTACDVKEILKLLKELVPESTINIEENSAINKHIAFPGNI